MQVKSWNNTVFTDLLSFVVTLSISVDVSLPVNLTGVEVAPNENKPESCNVSESRLDGAAFGTSWGWT